LFHVRIHFLSFLLKINVAFAAYATAKKRPFSQKFLGSVAVLFRPATRRTFAPPFTRPEDVYAVGVTYQGDEEKDNLANHRSLYLSLLGEDLAPGQSRRTQIRLIIDQFGSDSEKHATLYKEFLEEVKNIPRTYSIDPTN